MVSSKAISFPLSLGKSKKNTIKSQGGVVKSGRWIDVQEKLGNPPSWIKVESEGYLMDRSLSDIKYTIDKVAPKRLDNGTIHEKGSTTSFRRVREKK